MSGLIKNARRSIVVIAVLCAVVTVLFTAAALMSGGAEKASIFGYRGYIVRTDSMSRTDFAAGDFIIVKETDPATLQEGDIISFTSKSPESYGESITHKIRRLTEDENGEPAFVTYGTTTDSDDEQTVGYEQVEGRYLFRIPFVGRLLAFARTLPGYILCVFLPFLFLILLQIRECVGLYRQYRAELESEKKGKHLRNEE